jgi:glycosyltransferase involved in cell wall biosynthesis
MFLEKGNMQDQTLVIATRKNFWASPESLIFPKRVHTWILWGYSEDRFNTFLLVIRAWVRVWVCRPRVVLVSQAARAAVWFSWMIRCGFFPKSKWIAVDPVYLHDRHARFYSKVLVYCRNQLRSKKPEHYRYIPLPANGDFSTAPSARKPYFVSIGIAYRDFKSLVGAARMTGYPLVLVTKSRETLGEVGEIPPNVTVKYSIPIQECILLVAESRGVVVPLMEGEIPHGHSAVVQALRLGKAVISTKRATVDDYIEDGVDGLLVEPESAEGCAEAMKRLWEDDELVTRLEKNAFKKSEQFSYAYFAEELRNVVEGLNHV